jgi:RNA polymerase sigma-70 factor, ECF subfamily
MRDALSDEEVVRRVNAGETELYELLLRRHNQRLFRAVRALVQDDDEAEEALQLAWVNAWRRLATFAERARFTTWMTRIALRTAGSVARRRVRTADVARGAASEARRVESDEVAADSAAAQRELRALLERSIDALPEIYRVVFVLRVVEGLSTAEVARDLELTETAVKVRLFRAREHLKGELLLCAGDAGGFVTAWSFAGERCDRVVAGVFARIASASIESGSSDA